MENMDVDDMLENSRIQTGAPFTFEVTQIDGLFKYLATVIKFIHNMFI